MPDDLSALLQKRRKADHDLNNALAVLWIVEERGFSHRHTLALVTVARRRAELDSVDVELRAYEDLMTFNNGSSPCMQSTLAPPMGSMNT